MKYAQGSFITVPSKETLRGLDPMAQTLYMWLCSYANETGTCFPSRNTLANDVGCSDKSIDRMLTLLLEKGLVVKQRQIKEDAYTSNLYTVLVVGGSPSQSPPQPPTVARVAPESPTNSIHITQPIEVAEDREYTRPPKVIPTPYTVDGTREAWKNGERRLQVLEWYLTQAGLWKKATTKDKLKAIMVRHSNASKRVADAGWSPSELRVAKEKIDANESLQGEWTLETLEKYLTK